MASEYERPRIRRVIGRVIEIEHLSLPKGPSTQLTAAVAAAGTALTVIDNTQFTNSHFALIRPYGTQKAEIGDITSTSGGTTINLTSGVTFAHATGEEVRQIYFNQWRIYGNSTNTSVGATLVATVDMDVSEPFTTYINTGTEYSFYLITPFDSVDSVAGTNYSDGVSNSTGYASNSVQNLINQALTETKTTLKGNVDFAYCLAKLNEGMKNIRGRLKTWSSLQTFDYALGTVLQGSYSFTAPTDIYDTNTPRSVLGFRIGDNKNLTYKDKREWVNLLDDVVRTQVTTQATSGQTTLEIDNSYDFDDSGSVDVFVSGTKYTLTYTGVTRSATAGILTGIPASGTGSISVTIAVDTNVWQGEEEGTPTYWTVFDGSFYIWPLADSSHDNMNALLDYFTDVVEVDSAADTISFPRWDALKHWLKWNLRALKNDMGKLDLQDTDYLLFEKYVGDMILQELNSSGQKWKMRPKVYNLTGSTASNTIQ